MQLFKLNAKRQKFLMGILLITSTMMGAYLTFNLKSYLSVNEVGSSTSIIIKGEGIEEQFTPPEVKRNGLYFDRVNNYEYNASSSTSDVGYYISFPLFNLSPLEEYQLELSFTLKENLESIGNVLVQVSDIEPDFKYSTEDKSYSTNIGNKNESDTVLYNIVEGDDVYKTTLKFKANYEGKAWVVFGQEKPKSSSFNFDVSDITYKLEGVKIDNQLDQE